jgi:phage tail sheath gpL-like
MASRNISFDSIPSSIRKPGKYFEFNTKLAVRTLPGNLQKMLIVGQRMASGTVAQGVLVDIFSSDQAATFFGRGSMLHVMCKAAIIANPYLQLTAVALDDAVGSVAAEYNLVATNNATGPGVATARIGPDVVETAVATGDTPAAICDRLSDKLKALGDLQADIQHFNGVASITVTLKNKGALSAGIPVTFSITAGISTTLVTTPDATGSGDPSIQPALTAAFVAGHHIIVTPYNTSASLTVLRTHLDAVSGPMEQRGAIGVYGHTGSLGQATTLAGLINSGRITGILVPSSKSVSYEVAAAYGAVIASEEDPARPLNTLMLTGIDPSPLPNRLGRTEQENALNNGVTPSEIGPGEKVQIVRAITTYTLDPQAIPDISLFDLTTIRTLDYVRTACRQRIALRFPREKLSSKTPAKVRSELLDVLVKLEELEIVEEVEANKDGLIVERDLQDPNRLNAKIPTDVVNGLHVFAGRIDLLL